MKNKFSRNHVARANRLVNRPKKVPPKKGPGAVQRRKKNNFHDELTFF